MYRVVNLRKSLLLETSANVALSVHVNDGNSQKRQYFRLDLEISFIDFFASTWTLVHPIDEKSPFSQFDLNNLKQEDIEIVIQMKAFDNTFAQHVHSRYSYTQNDIVVGAKFRPASRLDEEGNLRIPLDEFHDYDVVEYK